MRTYLRIREVERGVVVTLENRLRSDDLHRQPRMQEQSRKSAHPVMYKLFWHCSQTFLRLFRELAIMMFLNRDKTG